VTGSFSFLPGQDEGHPCAGVVWLARDFTTVTHNDLVNQGGFTGGVIEKFLTGLD
jgi:hypothetical protein